MVIGNFTLSNGQTVYLRKQLTWSQKSAAYKLSLSYRYGIIVFINGNEILRDNLPQGVIRKSTPATGGYEDYQERIYVRDTNEFGPLTISLLNFIGFEMVQNLRSQPKFFLMHGWQNWERTQILIVLSFL